MEHHPFDASSKHPATHQPGVDPPLILAVRHADHDPDHTVVTEPVAQADLQGENVLIGFECAHVRFCVPAAGEVELIAFVD